MDFYRDLEVHTGALQKQVNMITDYHRLLQSQARQVERDLQNAQSSPDQKKTARERRESVLGKMTQIDSMLQLLTLLRSKVGELYTARTNAQKKFKRLSAGDVAELKNYYEVVHSMVTELNKSLFPTEAEKRSKNAAGFRNLEELLDRDRTLVNLVSEKDGLSLPESVYKVYTEKNFGQYNDQQVQFKWPGFFEYETMFLGDPGMSHDQALARYIQKSPQEVKAEYEQYASTNPRAYEYPPNRNRIAPNLRNTGNVATINTALETDDALPEGDPDKLTFREREMLKHHRDATLKVEQVEQSIQGKLREGQELGRKPRVLKTRGGGVQLEIDQDRFQTSANGCWSCSGYLMARSRGVSNVTQEEIRCYRPDLGDEQVLANDDVDENYSVDRAKPLKDNADSVLRFAPNSMMHTVEIAPYSPANEADGYSSAKYIQNTVNALKQMINHAITVDHSPVAMYRPGHYITIVGIEGDEVLYKDSNQWRGRKEPPNHTFRRSLKDMVERSFFYEHGAHSIEINWLSDIQLAKDGKSIHGVPSQYVYMKEDGTVTKQPDAMLEAMGDFGSRLNRVGVPVLRIAQDEEEALKGGGKNNYGSMGVLMSERVYLPKKLNAEYLKKRANARSAKDEEKLNNADTNFYKIKPGKIDPATVEEQIRQRIREIEHEAKPGEYDDGSGELKDLRQQAGSGSQSGKQGDEPKPVQQKKEEEGPDIDTRSEDTKKKEQEDKLRKKIDERIENADRPYLDDTGISSDFTAASRKAMDAHMKGISRKAELDKERQQIEAKEKAAADKLKAEHTDERVVQKASELIETMNRHSHWYLWNTTGAYKQLLQSLERVRNLGRKALDPAEKDQFTPQDRKDLEVAILQSAELAKTYLSSKVKEMEQDPNRRNKLSKEGNEQPRIGAVLDAFDFFSEAALAVKAKGKAGEKDILYAVDDINAEYNQFVRELVADREDPNAVQEDSISNRLHIPATATAALNRLESLFGLAARGGGSYDKVAGIDQLTGMKMFPSIGGSKSYRLSSKDFAALAIAASTTPEAMRGSWKGADPEGRFTEKQKLSYYAGETLHGLLHGKKEGVAAYISEIKRSRNLANAALKEYFRGDKDRLARLIANGIRNLDGLGAGGRFAGEKVMELFSSEMGLRMKSMLERDPELMKKALGYGVTPRMLKNMKNNGVEAGKGILADQWQRKARQDKEDSWGIREKERNYVDMLVNRYMEEERRLVVSERERAPEYKTELKELEDRYRRREVNDRAAYKKERLDALKSTTACRNIENTLQSTFDKGKMTAGEKGTTARNIRKAMVEKTVDIETQVKMNISGYEEGLVRKYAERMKQTDAKNWPGGYEKAERSTLVRRALEYERISCGAKQPTEKEALKNWQDARKQLANYDENTLAVRKLAVLSQRFNATKAANEQAKEVELHVLKTKKALQVPSLDEISDPGVERALRTEFREYIRDKGYLDYPPKRFLEEVVGTERKPETRKRNTLKIELGKMRVTKDLLKERELRLEREKAKPEKTGSKPAGKAAMTNPAGGAAMKKPAGGTTAEKPKTKGK